MMLTLLLLLILSSASLQKTVNSQDRNASSLSPDLEDQAPEITANMFVSRRLLPPAQSRQKKSLFSIPFENGKLKWHRWTGSPPTGAVSIFNDYTNHRDFICRNKCESGFYRPTEDSVCHIPRNNAEIDVTDFEILVNEDNFEILEWKDGYSGSLPRNPVRTCTGVPVYVGKNKYGLGKVVPEQRSFFLPWKGSEYWYWTYKVLTTNDDVVSNFITDVRYNTDRTTLVPDRPEIMHVFVTKNYDCNPVSKSTTYTKKVQEAKGWDLSPSITLGVQVHFIAGLPVIVSGDIEISANQSFFLSKENIVTEEITRSGSVDLKVPPNHSCKVEIKGIKYKIQIPFTARFRRIYRSGKIAWMSFSGKYESVQLDQIHSVVERCKPIDSSSPCPQENVIR